MHFKFRNVNDAFRGLVRHFHGAQTYGSPKSEINKVFCNVPMARKDSRNGPVLMIEEPVIVTYANPMERVLFNSARDANPFLHLYESLWMLAGRNDVAPLAYYAANMRNYSDDGETLNGAYGYRWKHAQVPDHQNWDDGDGVNQLDILVAHLKADPNSRRAVLQMWNCEDDLLKIGGFGNRERCKECRGIGGINEGPVDDTGPDVWKDCPTCNRTGWVDEAVSRDVCCNLSVMFSIREERNWEGEHHTAMPLSPRRFLDMTVTNRSNDLCWGMLGANAVHFAFLQEYMAARIGVEVGTYNQISNNLHVYLNDVWKPEEFLKDGTPDFYENNVYPIIDERGFVPDYCYEWESGRYVPLVKNPKAFDLEVKAFVELNKNGDEITATQTWLEPFLDTVAQPMMHAFHMYKVKEWDAAFYWVNRITASDWKMAAKNWIAKRHQRYLKKGAANVPASAE